MCKKVGIAVLAVVLGLIVVKGTSFGRWVASHVRHGIKDAREWVKGKVPLEREIARLKDELKNQEKEDDKQFDRVANLAVQVKKMERQLDDAKKKRDAEKTRLLKFDRELTGNVKFLIHNGDEYTRADLNRDLLTFERTSRAVDAKTRALTAKKKQLALEKKTLGELKTMREEMAAELERLEATLIEERQAQAENARCVDSSGYRKIRSDMDAVRDRLEEMQTKRELKGEFKPAVKAKQNKEQDTKAEKILEQLRKDHKVAID